jgi:tripartite-type tricarboxylate transporter receptor subunit TctC
MRVLASAEDARLASSPEAPTLKELGYDITSCSMFVVSAPPHLPDDVKTPLAAALESAIASPEMTALIARLRYPEYYFGPDDVTRLLEDETATFARAVEHLRQ